jgi:hypothetical protein
MSFWMASATGSIEPAGIALPGNGCPVSGSMIVSGLPNASTLREKSPPRSSSVGITPGCVVEL